MKKKTICLILLGILIVQLNASLFLLDINPGLKTVSNNPSNQTGKTPDSRGFIKNWLHTGVFQESNNWSTYPTLNGSQVMPVNETTYYKAGDLIQKNNSMDQIIPEKVWYETEEPSSEIINMANIFPNSFDGNVSAYFLTYVYFPEQVNEVFAYAGSDNGIRIYHNGSEVYYNHSIRTYQKDQDIIPLGKISQGWHSFFIVVENVKKATNDWRFSMRFSKSESSFEEIDGISIDLNYKNEQETRYVFLFDEEPTEFTKNNFTELGGEITSGTTDTGGKWNIFHGFGGTINASLIPYFVSNISQEVRVSEDKVIAAQMNTVHNQLKTYPYVINQSDYGYLGDSNSSIAFLDSGIDDSHIVFNETYDELNFSRKIMGWEDIIGNEQVPSDLYGHGTSMAAIAAGGGDGSLETNNTGGNLYFTLGGNYSHYDLFYPNHLTPGEYQVKLGSFNVSSSNSNLIFNGTLDPLNPEYQLDVKKLDLYLNGSPVKSSEGLNLTYTTSTSNNGIFDLFFTYSINTGDLPEFNLIVNGTFKPNNELSPYANFSGIAPHTKIVSLKILNKTGIGYTSDLITALHWVHHNNSKYHIGAISLSIGNFDMDDLLTEEISNLITQIINNGTMVVIAAGNQGAGSNKLNKLAYNSKAIVVGSINDEDQISYFSSQGKIIDGKVIKPDLVAPGGSLLPDHQTIITAETNNDTNEQEKHLNDLTSVYGTSVSAAIVSGVYHLIMEHQGGWENWNTTDGHDALWAKSLMLMTATEVNQAREDNPKTTSDEGDLIPELNRGSSDAHEGFGKINPKAILDLLNSSLEIDQKIEDTLFSSNVEPWGNHVFATNITLEKDEIYYFNLSNSQNLDADIHIYREDPDPDGYPIEFKKNTNIGAGENERFYYTHVNETQTCYIVVKAVSGSGNFSLNVSNPTVENVPNLNNTYWGATSNYNDSLDTFTFYVNYSQSENFAPNYIYFRTNHSEDMNYTMEKVDENDINYIDGCLYSVDYKFGSEGNFTYHFFTRTGDKTYNYTNNVDEEFSIYVNEIEKEIAIGEYFNYENEFDGLSDTNLWEYDPQTVSINFQGENIDVYSGWDWITVMNQLEERRQSILETELATWGALYFGISGTLGVPHTPLLIDNEPIYSYLGLTGTYDLRSPHIYINGSKNTIDQPYLRLGCRWSVSQGDEIEVQVNANRTGWETLAPGLTEFNNEQKDWTMINADLSDYNNTYIQIRIRANILGVSTKYSRGFMLDYFSLYDKNETNNNSPELSKPSDFEGNTLDYVESTNPSDLNTEFDTYIFQVDYKDDDGNYPDYVYLEIDGKNYTMENEFGRWNSDPDIFGYNIRYSLNMNLFNITNTTYRFHAFDGQFNVNTDYIEGIEFEAPSLEGIIHTPFNSTTDQTYIENSIIYGTPTPIIETLWMASTNTWHQVSELGEVLEDDEWYCGEGTYNGYGNGWDTSLILPIMNLNGTNEIFLHFTQDLTLSGEGGGGDLGEVLISKNFGEDWKSLETFETETDGEQREIIDLTNFINETILLRFRFKSDEEGFEFLPNTGWTVKDFFIDINRTRDYQKPDITFLNFQNNQEVSEIIDLSIKFSDNSEIPIKAEDIEIFINYEKLNVSKYYNETTGYLNYTIDTWDYENGDIIEVVCTAKDAQGNSQIRKMTFRVANPFKAWQLSLIIIFPALLAALIIYKVWKTRHIRKLMAEGDYTPKPSLRDRLTQKRFEKERDREEAQKILDRINQEKELKNWEKAQPFYMHCKNCEEWYQTTEFEIFCPTCGSDSLYISKRCPVCKDWKYFDFMGKHECKKCEIELLKDFKKARKKIISWQNEQEIMDLEDERSFEKEKKDFEEREGSDQKKKELLTKLVNELPEEELEELMKERLKEKQQSIKDEGEDN